MNDFLLGVNALSFPKCEAVKTEVLEKKTWRFSAFVECICAACA